MPATKKADQTDAGPTSVDTDKPVINAGDHDRIQAVSIAKDGTPDQSPGFEFIGDKDTVLEATKEQFRQIAVSAVDAEKRAELGLAGPVNEGDTSDAAIDALRKEHEKAEAAGEKAAEALVNAAHKGD
jgi:hypothetical protein